MWFLLALMLAAWQAEPPSPGRLSQAEFKALLAGKAVIAVDVRREQEFREEHIPGAISLPLAEFLQEPQRYERVVARLRGAKESVVTYCACSGDVSSLRVAGLLQERGVRNVRVLTGGWADWVNAGNSTEKAK